MKTSTLATVLLGVFLIFATTSCFQGPIIKGSKNYLTKEVNVDNFNAVKLLGSANIIYQQDSRTHVEICGSDNIVPLVEAFTTEGTLTIKFKTNVNIMNPGKLEIKIYSPDLNKLMINGSGDVIFANGIDTQKNIELEINGSGNIKGASFKCQNLAITISGSGDIRLKQISSQYCSAHISGSGNIALSGKTNENEFHISGSGDISASNLKSVNTSASASGSGNISCFVTGKLSGHISGSGDVSYKSNPQEIDFPRKRLHKID